MDLAMESLFLAFISFLWPITGQVSQELQNLSTGEVPAELGLDLVGKSSFLLPPSLLSPHML